MKTLKKLAVAFVVLVAMGATFASCNEDAYYEEPIDIQHQIPVEITNPTNVEIDLHGN
ncbi:hypothetical protein SLH46_14680 [Draconibacterium sp. IB214405]|uniref:hypothetical protein n=1 Tax=Draconibacterium sp. IB214405 TaxID=3097352 RepID=UPI002A0C22AF|nr:hypothetical protein [Draconibacterium sp. IB214405]MDX8340445.1 hypothetical protein [Draconibacterium sp. IB214405]